METNRQYDDPLEQAIADLMPDIVDEMKKIQDIDYEQIPQVFS